MPNLTVEITSRKRRYSVEPISAGTRGMVEATCYRVNVAGVKGSVAVAYPRLWVEKHSTLGKRLARNLGELHSIMDALPAGQSYSVVWF